MNYNPFFPGGSIGMARVLFDGLVEFEDGQLYMPPHCMYWSLTR